MSETIPKYQVKYQIKYFINPDMFFNSDGQFYSDIVVGASVDIKIINKDGMELAGFEKTFSGRYSVEKIDIQSVYTTIQEEIEKYVENIQQKVKRTEEIVRLFYYLTSQNNQ